MENDEGRQTASDYMLLLFEYAHKALRHGPIAEHWLKHVGSLTGPYKCAIGPVDHKRYTMIRWYTILENYL